MKKDIQRLLYKERVCQFAKSTKYLGISVYIQYKVVTKEVVKRLKFIPSTFEVVEEVTYVYSCPKGLDFKNTEKIGH